MHGKYGNWPRYGRGEGTLAAPPSSGQFGNLANWQPLENPRRGYSIVIGCNTPLAEMLGANLKMLERQRLENLDRIFIVLDQPRSQMHFRSNRNCASFPDLPLHFIYYTDHQSETARKVGQPWVYAWLSWCLGIGAAKRRGTASSTTLTRC